MQYFARKTLVFGITLVSLVLGARHTPAADCNQNGVEDALDLEPPAFKFISAEHIGLDGEPVAIIPADLDGDRHLDLAIVGLKDTSGCVWLLLNRGDGTFKPPAHSILGDFNPQAGGAAIEAADLDGDRDLDLVVVLPEALYVLMNRGGGALDEPRAYVLEAVRRTGSLIAADFDGDSDIDIVSGGGPLAIFSNNGDGTFTSPVYGPCSFDVVAADFDGDGDLDLATGGPILLLNNNGSFELESFSGCDAIIGNPIVAVDLDGDRDIDLIADDIVFMNKGDATFEEGFSVVDSWNHWSMAVDLNLDGLPDLVGWRCFFPVGCAGVRVSINQGDGTFSSPVEVSSYGTQFVVSDLDGDGWPDLITGSVTLHFNGKDGAFQEETLYELPGSSGLVGADLDGDGNPELIGIGSHAGISILRNRGDRRFEGARVYSGFAGQVSADFDHDGDLDLAVWDYPQLGLGHEGGIVIQVNCGDGAFRLGPRLGPTGAQGTLLVPVDLNGDGVVDLAGLGGVDRQEAWVFINTGDGTFEPGLVLTTGQDPGDLVAADMDGDGRIDLATANSTGQSVTVLINDGKARFASNVDYRVDSYAYELSCADFDRDGDLDLAVLLVGPTSSVRTLSNRGDGSFQTASISEIGSYAASLVASDFNSDGAADLIALNTFGPDGYAPPAHATCILFNRGDGSFDEAVHLDTGGFPNAVTTADLDRDGRPDVVVSSTTRGPVYTGSLFAFRSRGDRSFEHSQGYILPLPPFQSTMGSIVHADIDGDGWLDLLIGSFVLLNRRDGTFGEALDLFSGGALIAADFNGDMRLDLVMGNAVLLSRTPQAASSDANRNGIPDECETRFHRGDPDSSGAVNITDAIAIFGFLFLGDPPTLSCKETADVNNNGTIDISDGVSILNWLFIGGPAPAAPGPTGMPCGIDPDPPGSPNDLGCESYSCN